MMHIEMIAAGAQQEWLETFKSFLQYCLPPVENTPVVNVAGILAVIAGIILVFRGGKFEKIIVTGFGVVVGCWMGYRVATFVGTPIPITMALVSILVAGVAFRFYRIWLAAGSVVILFGLALLFQLGRSDLQANFLRLMKKAESPPVKTVQLVSPSEQQRNLYPDPADQLRKLKDVVKTELQNLGPTGWLIPAAAAVIGGILAYWALRIFVIIWLGFIGAQMVVIGGATVICAYWHDVQNEMLAQPHIPAFIALGLWLAGLIYQAQEARFPKKPAVKAPKEQPKP